MMDDHEDAASAILQFSFLDTLSCGMGAAVLLFLLVSIARPAPHAERSTNSFISAEWVVDDHEALLNVQIDPPSGAPFDISMEDIDASGTLQISGRHAERIVLYGFSRDGSLERVGSRGERVYTLLVVAPDPGEWALGVRYMNRSTTGGWTQGRAVRLSGSLTTPAGEIEMMAPAFLEFAATSEFRPIQCEKLLCDRKAAAVSAATLLR